MDHNKVIEETREIHQNFSRIELRINLFLSFIFKVLFSRTGTFLSVLIVPFGINIFFFFASANAMRLISGIIVSCLFAAFGMKYLIKTEVTDELYQQEVWTLITLKKMIKERQNNKNGFKQ